MQTYIELKDGREVEVYPSYKYKPGHRGNYRFPPEPPFIEINELMDEDGEDFMDEIAHGQLEKVREEIYEYQKEQ